MGKFEFWASFGPENHYFSPHEKAVVRSKSKMESKTIEKARNQAMELAKEEIDGVIESNWGEVSSVMVFFLVLFYFSL